jgi:lipopolysaccharide exporter
MTARLKRQVIRALPWSFAEGVINGLAGLALIFILAWFLEPKELGEATIALAVVGIVEIVAGLGMIEALVGARSGHTRLSDTAFSTVMLGSLAAAALCWALAGPIAHFYNDPNIAPLLSVAALLLPLNALAAVPTAVLTRKMRAGALSLRMMASRIVTIAAIGILAALKFGAWALVVGTVIGSVAAIVALGLTMARWPRLRFHWTEFRSLIVFGTVLSLERLLWGATIRLFWLAVGYVHGTATLGYFQFAQRFIDETANLVQTFSLRFGLSFFAALERAGKDPTDAYLRATRLVTVIAAPIFTGLALVMPDLIGTIFDAKWTPAVIVAQISALGWIVAFPRVFVGPILRARGRQGPLVVYALMSSIVTLGGVFLTGGQALYVVALAWVSHHLIGVPWGLYAINRYIGISPQRQIAQSLRPWIATAIMAAAVLGVGMLTRDWAAASRLVVTVTAGTVSYAAAVALIDRKTMELGRSLLTDLMQIRRNARSSA